MEAKLMKYSSDQYASPYKQQQKITTPKKVGHVFNSKPSENLASRSIHGYPLLNPPMSHHSLSFSCPSPALFNHLMHYQYQTMYKQQQQGQPPLLPLPSRKQPVSTNKKIKKGCKKTKPAKKEDAKPSRGNCNGLLGTGKTSVGPDPNELPRDVFSSIVAPPPSSLPLPKFSIRPKNSCKGEAVEGDASCASNDLRRILRIR